MEDVGLGNPNAPVLAETLYRMHQRYPRPQRDRFLFAAHLVRVLSTSTKDRISDEMVNWARNATALGAAMPKIPDFALDMYTRVGAGMGRDFRHFLEEASHVDPVLQDRDEKCRNWLLAALGDGRLSQAGID